MFAVRLLSLVLAALLGAGASYFFYTSGSWSSYFVLETKKPISSAESRGPSAPVSVAVAPVRREKVPIYISGIGTVQAYNTVAVKTRVDGHIKQVLFKEGQEVKVGNPLVIIDPDPFQAQLEQLRATRQKDIAILGNAKLDLERYEDLIKRNAVSRQQLDTQRALVEQIKAQVAADEAQIVFAQTQLDYTKITSPIDGRIGIRRIDAGNVVRAADNETIAVIMQFQPISVIISVPARDVARSKLVPGRSDLQVLAFAQDDVTLLARGTLDLVDNAVDQTTGTIKLKASFPNNEMKLWPGDFVNCRIIVETRDNGLTVPTASVRHGPRGDFTWVIKSDKTAEARTVAVRQTNDGRALIERGLRVDEQVVVEGQYRLQIGSPVTIVPSATASR